MSGPTEIPDSQEIEVDWAQEYEAGLRENSRRRRAAARGQSPVWAQRGGDHCSAHREHGQGSLPGSLPAGADWAGGLRYLDHDFYPGALCGPDHAGHLQRLYKIRRRVQCAPRVWQGQFPTLDRPRGHDSVVRDGLSDFLAGLEMGCSVFAAAPGARLRRQGSSADCAGSFSVEHCVECICLYALRNPPNCFNAGF